MSGTRLKDFVQCEIFIYSYACLSRKILDGGLQAVGKCVHCEIFIYFYACAARF